MAVLAALAVVSVLAVLTVLDVLSLLSVLDVLAVLAVMASRAESILYPYKDESRDIRSNITKGKARGNSCWQRVIFDRISRVES